MKTSKNETQTENSATNSQAVALILEKMDKEAPENAEITLGQLEKETGLSRGEVVRQLRSFRNGKGYIVGRKGKESRWTNKPITTHKSNPAPRKHTIIDSGSELKFKLSIGGQDIYIPLNIKTELVAA